MTGVIKRLEQSKGYGFIRPEGGTADYFFHRSGVTDEGGFEILGEGDRVFFEIEASPKGPRGTNVSRL